MQSPEYNVLNFFYDEEDSCALTILAKQTRFHIIADVDNIRHKPGSPAGDPDIWELYSQLLARYKQASEGQDVGSSSSSSPDESIDSGVDMESSLTDKGAGPERPHDVDAEAALYAWLISPLRPTLDKVAGASQHHKQTLTNWYSLPTRFYNLRARDGQLHPEELESTPDLEQRMSKLRPNLTPVPKYIRQINVPWFSSEDIEVLDCSNSPPPYHPATVKVSASSETLFLKSVDNANIQPTKREISLLHRLEKKGLHDKIRCPRLKGIVTHDGDGHSIMGFLQTLIPGPVPLTEKFESHIPQEKRERWAQEAEQIKDTLHEHGIIWGDAKGDNFVVDSTDELWIIDFGGSYTDGWVDPEIAETKEGDDMGVDKVVNALRDPDRNVARDSEDQYQKSENIKADKRKGFDDEELKENKRQRTDARRRSPAADDSTQPRYCYCRGISGGQMIKCDGYGCTREWFHLDCTNLAELPGEEDTWFCRKCESH